MGQVEALPLSDNAVSKAITVHTVNFWNGLDQGFRELFRCLQPGGRLVVGFVPKAQMDRMGMPADLFTSRDPEALAKVATQAGFEVEMRQPKGRAPWMVLAGRKPRT